MAFFHTPRLGLKAVSLILIPILIIGYGYGSELKEDSVVEDAPKEKEAPEAEPQPVPVENNAGQLKKTDPNISAKLSGALILSVFAATITAFYLFSKYYNKEESSPVDIEMEW
ncbi:hypothetical protein ACFL5V_00795 [Fibrobacterota bacterium]